MTLVPIPFPGDTVLFECGFEATAPDGTPAPSAYRFPKYQLIETYGKAEAEEVAARLITLCQRAGRWVALSYSALWRQVADEYEERFAGVYTIITIELARFGTDANSAVRRVIDVGLDRLKDDGYIRIESYGEGDDASDVVILEDTFFERIQRFATAVV